MKRVTSCWLLNERILLLENSTRHFIVSDDIVARNPSNAPTYLIPI